MGCRVRHGPRAIVTTRLMQLTKRREVVYIARGSVAYLLAISTGKQRMWIELNVEPAVIRETVYV